METRGLQGAKRLAWLLDDLVRVPGTNIRFGLDPLLGLLPGGGDVAGGVISAYTIVAASRAGAPASVLLRMVGNLAVDLVLGIIPVIGDLFDVGWKANRRNVALLEQYLDRPATVRRSSRVVLVLVLIAVVALLAGAIALSVSLIGWLFSSLR